MRELKDIINESFSKEYGYKIKVARDCSDDLAIRINIVQVQYC